MAANAQRETEKRLLESLQRLENQVQTLANFNRNQMRDFAAGANSKDSPKTALDDARASEASNEEQVNLAGKTQKTRLALDLALKAKSEGNNDLAKIYYISAMTHSPGDAEILSSYADAVLSARPSAEEIAQLRSIVQVAMYQVSPEEIPKALEILAKTTPHPQDKGSSPGKNDAKTDWAARFSASTSRPLDTIFSDSTQLQARIDELTEISEALGDHSSADGKLETQVRAELRKTEQTLAANRITALLDQYLTNLNSAVDSNPTKAMSIVQAAESVMLQLWSFDLAAVPELLQNKIDTYPSTFKSEVDRLAEIKSAPFLDVIQNQIKITNEFSAAQTKPKLDQVGPLQTHCDKFESCITTAHQAYTQISSENVKKKAEPVLVKLREELVSTKRKQFDAYQKWVVEKISDAFSEDKKEWFTSKDDTIKRFHQFMIVNIDQSSLSPETARVFNDVVGRFMSNLDARRTVDVERDMSNTKKMKPDNF